MPALPLAPPAAAPPLDAPWLEPLPLPLALPWLPLEPLDAPTELELLLVPVDDVVVELLLALDVDPDPDPFADVLLLELLLVVALVEPELEAVVAGVQAPPMQVPPVHAVPSATGGLLHVPLDESQVPALWHSSLAVQVTGVPALHTPPEQVSPVVQPSLSLHEAPSAFAVLLQMWRLGSHVARWHVSLAWQSESWLHETHVPVARLHNGMAPPHWLVFVRLH